MAAIKIGFPSSMTLTKTIRPCIWVLGWSLVFVVNLIVPLHMGISLTSGGGRIGLAIAIVGLWLLGVFVCLRTCTLRLALLGGGLLVGFSQVAPILHVAVGLTALELWNGPKDYDTRFLSKLSGLGGFIVTAIVELSLMAIAVIVGYFLLAVHGLLHPTDEATAADQIPN